MATNTNTSSSTKNDNGIPVEEDAYADDLEPVAGLSSASACIQFHLNLQNTADKKNKDEDEDSHNSHMIHEHMFHPVYTHQIFHNEAIHGFVPFQKEQQTSFAIASKYM